MSSTAENFRSARIKSFVVIDRRDFRNIFADLVDVQKQIVARFNVNQFDAKKMRRRIAWLVPIRNYLIQNFFGAVMVRSIVENFFEPRRVPNHGRLLRLAGV